MIGAALAGLLGGLAIILTMYRTGMLNERSGLAILVGAIAFFYPVFAVQAGAGVMVIALHTFVFLLFSWLALTGYARSTRVLAWALIAHGLFDAATALTGHPGPTWWPAFCGALDLTAGALLLILLSRKDIAK